MTDTDAARVLAIYEEGIATGHATFEHDLLDWIDWDRARLAVGRLVAETAGEVVAWGALTAVSLRPVYGGVAEVGIYVAAAGRGRGIGRALLAAVVAAAEEHGLWTLQAGIFPENEASLRLFEAAGFRTVGIRKRIGRMRHGPHAGRWRDVVLMERRSDRDGPP